MGKNPPKKNEEGTLFDHEDVKLSTRSGRPAKVQEHDIDLRVPGLSYAVVKEAEHLRVQQLVKKIENHPHWEALRVDLQQSNVCNHSLKFEGDDPRIGQWGVNQVVRKYQKYNVLTVFLLESRNCVLDLRTNSWLTANPEESLTNWDWMHSLSWTTR